MSVQRGDARRLTGWSPFLDAPGVAGELRFSAPWATSPEDAVLSAVREAFARAGFVPAAVRVTLEAERRGLTVAVACPPDRLDPAADLLDDALDDAALTLANRPVAPDPARDARHAEALRRAHDPLLLSLLEEATARGLPVLLDDEALTVGAGSRGRTWPRSTWPALSDVDWGALGGVPTALVTGTNGKTTTARLLSSILAAAGHVVGQTSTTGLRVGAESLDDGDWSGPGGARRVLRDPRVTAAVLETARGGLLRRGLAITGHDVAVLTNIADDHYGDYGIVDRAGMAQVKAVVGHAVSPRGVVVRPTDDPALAALPFAARVLGFTHDPARLEGEGYTVIDGAIARVGPSGVTLIVPVADVPFAFHGLATHNVRNALAAAAAAEAMGAPTAAIAAGLRAATPTVRDAPGRHNRFDAEDRTVILDFAHNADSVAAALALAWRAHPSRPRVVSLGMPGDRTDADLDAVLDAVVASGAQRLIARELNAVRRGRAPGEVPRRLAERAASSGITVEQAPDDLGALDRVLALPGPYVAVILAILDVPGAVAALLGAGFREP